MKPDKLDMKIQEAAAQNEPAYNERAWSDMEKLLDKEMPQKKKEKRRILWIFLLMFMVTGSLLMLNPSGKSTTEKGISAKTNSASEATNIHDSNSGGVVHSTLKDSNQHTVLPSQPTVPEIINRHSFSVKSIQNSKTRTIKKDKTTVQNERTIYVQNNSTENKTMINNQILNPDKNGKTEQPDIPQSTFETIKKDKTESSKNEHIIKSEKSKSLKEGNDKDTSHKKTFNSQNRNKFVNSFAINFSVGPDVSAVNIGNIGKINPVFGAGISYSIGKKWNLRTGFYVEKKVYGTEATNYHPPAGFWNYYPDLSYISANCKVYEVPLIINYNFSQTSTRIWFVSAGISSYFMKKEKYYYTPKNPLVQYTYNSYTVNNKNRHYFSSLRLSGGYERKFNNIISIIAEPYINLPIGGVGYGKVKLYSTGILFTLSIKPFAKK